MMATVPKVRGKSFKSEIGLTRKVSEYYGLTFFAVFRQSDLQDQGDQTSL
jgi:hypothetical protein